MEFLRTLFAIVFYKLGAGRDFDSDERFALRWQAAVASGPSPTLSKARLLIAWRYVMLCASAALVPASMILASRCAAGCGVPADYDAAARLAFLGQDAMFAIVAAAIAGRFGGPAMLPRAGILAAALWAIDAWAPPYVFSLAAIALGIVGFLIVLVRLPGYLGRLLSTGDADIRGRMFQSDTVDSANGAQADALRVPRAHRSVWNVAFILVAAAGIGWGPLNARFGPSPHGAEASGPANAGPVQTAAAKP